MSTSDQAGDSDAAKKVREMASARRAVKSLRDEADALDGVLAELDAAKRRADAAEQLVQVLSKPRYDPNRLQLG